MSITKKIEVQGIFPTPVYITKLSRKFNETEMSLFKNFETIKNVGNLSTKENYILNNKNLLNLKKQLLSMTQDYCNNIICIKNVKPVITQSWLNYTKENEYHHKHNHSNSYVSGVLYIDVDENNNKIYFYKNKFETIKPEVKEYNCFNSDTWFFPVKNYQVILFPSSLEHSVETKLSKNTRISLAFNIFLKGTLGSKLNLNELKI